ncbi:hypothetical protein Smp_140470 [Schistosoma mansoni]|uniref:hypothetical protein n=1 Tax=Schistosoma mansoni TaxID=6183 RepID=UPI0001A63BE1|nr:hypothetical protein Smp_140470 [Schistosoma mansoni]|eukprot:XP_018645242.1 hypothetical protein Smp_140470 [Schistosoma mansoni]
MKLTPVNPINAHPSMCGQCEDKKAVVLCQECSEYYCAKCFATFHLKGALRRHHSLPVSGCQSSFNIATKSNLALQTEALNDPDQYGTPIKTPLTTEQSSATVSHITSIPYKTFVPVEIYFRPSISYAEKLLLRSHRNSKLRQPIGQEGLDGQKVSERNFLPNLSIEEQEKNQNGVMENCTLNRNSFDELHKLATTRMQLSNDNPHVFSHSKLDSEKPITQTDEIMYPINDESNENYSSTPLFDVALCELTRQKENTGKIHKGQSSQISDEDDLVNEIHEHSKIMGM